MDLSWQQKHCSRHKLNDNVLFANFYVIWMLNCTIDFLATDLTQTVQSVLLESFCPLYLINIPGTCLVGRDGAEGHLTWLTAQISLSLWKCSVPVVAHEAGAMWHLNTTEIHNRVNQVSPMLTWRLQWIILVSTLCSSYCQRFPQKTKGAKCASPAESHQSM